MNRGSLEVTLYMVDETEVKISCFIQVADPDDGEEVHDSAMDAITDYIEEYDEKLIDGEAEIYFGDSVMYLIAFGRVEGEEDKWGIATAEGTVTLH
tara:strand:+ start:132 stop:419 length:288 start_codon:yes stop_codon:yes gene_type:complete